MESPPKQPSAAPIAYTEKTLAQCDIEIASSASVPSEKTPQDVGPPPDGGFAGWLQVAGSFFLVFNCWGSVYVFGAFQAYYQTNSEWTATASAISWVGSMQAFLLLLGGAVTGPAYDAGYFRHLIALGTFLVSFGYMMTSISKTYWQVMLAQGICIGLGNGCLFLPSVAVLPQYFTKRRALAMGLANTGSSFAGIIYPITFHFLVDSVGFGWATRLLGFLSFVTSLFSVVVMRQRAQSKQKRKLLQLSAFKDLPYTLFNIAGWIGFLGLFTPISYIGVFSYLRGYSSKEFAFYLIPILNVACIPGRLIPCFIADRVGTLNVLTPCAFVAGILSLCWIGVSSLGGTIAFAILYGIFSSGYIALVPITIVTLSKDMNTLGTRLGQSFFVGAFGLLIGTPVAGAILGNNSRVPGSNPNWLGMQVYAGTTVLACAVGMVLTRASVTGWVWKAKA